MTKSYSSAVKDAIYLASCMINGLVPDAQRVGGMNLADLHTIASFHLLSGIVGYALEAAGIKDPYFSQEKAKATRKVALFDIERNAVMDRLEDARIKHMMLKGCVLESLYPKIGMRQMADNDIYFDPSRSTEVKAIMESLGFETINFGTRNSNHDQYYKNPVCNFEMHRALFGSSSDNVFSAYYSDLQSKMIPDDGKNYRFHLSDEDFYIYMIAHEYKHYSGSGTGIRSLLDTYVCLRKLNLDMEFIQTEMEKLNLVDFEKTNRLLALHLFDGMPLSDKEQAMFDYILSSGTYGNLINNVMNQVQKKGRLGYIFSRLTLPLSVMRTRYPVLVRFPVLYPFCWLHRILHGLITNRRVVMYKLKVALFHKTWE